MDEHQVQRLLQAALGCTPEASRVWACARQLGLDATLWRHQEALGLKFRSLVGPPAQWRAHLADTIARRHDLGVLLQGYTRPVVLLKGEGMASDLYGDPYARRSGDIDLLVPWSEVQSLAAHLEARGYLPRTLTPPPRSLYNQWEWEHPETCRVVEIHWALANPQVPMPPAQEVIARAIWTRLSDQLEVLTPSPEHLFFLVCAHHHHHSGFLKGLVDVAAWRQKYGQTWEARCLESARALGCEGVCSWPLDTLDVLFGVPGSGGLMARLSAARVRGALDRRGGVGGGELLGMKTQGVSRQRAFLWRLAGVAMLDGWGPKVRAGVELVVGHPADFGDTPGSPLGWAAWRAWAGRPLRALRKARRKH